MDQIGWRVRLLENRPGLIGIICLAAVGAGLTGLFLFQSPSMGLLGFAMILASTADYWLGSHFMVDPKGVRARVGISLTAMEWKDVKRVTIEPHAIKLSPLESGNRMDVFRGVVLRTKPDLKVQVLDLIRTYMPASAHIETSDVESPR